MLYFMIICASIARESEPSKLMLYHLSALWINVVCASTCTFSFCIQIMQTTVNCWLFFWCLDNIPSWMASVNTLLLACNIEHFDLAVFFSAAFLILISISYFSYILSVLLKKILFFFPYPKLI